MSPLPSRWCRTGHASEAITPKEYYARPLFLVRVTSPAPDDNTFCAALAAEVHQLSQGSSFAVDDAGLEGSLASMAQEPGPYVQTGSQKPILHA